MSYPLQPDAASTFEAFGVSSIPQGDSIGPTGRIVSGDNDEFEALIRTDLESGL